MHSLSCLLIFYRLNVTGDTHLSDIEKGRMQVFVAAELMYVILEK